MALRNSLQDQPRPAMRRQSSRDEARQPPQPMRRKNSDEDLSAAFGRLGTASPSAVAYDGGSTSYATGSGGGGATSSRTGRSAR